MSVDEPIETEHTPEVSWCPDCQAPPKSDFAHVQYCSAHMPTTGGEVDRLVDQSSYITNTDAGGEPNQRLCDFIHRRVS